jgi:hypothetical protein
MTYARRRADREHEYDRHPALTPLVIDLIPDQTRAELEASIDEPLTVERGPTGWESEESHFLTGGNIGAGKTFDTQTELLAGVRENSESGSDAASDLCTGENHYD